MKAYTHYRATALLARLLILQMLSGCSNTSKQLSIPNRKYDHSAIFATSSTLPFTRFTCLIGVTFMFFAGWLGYGISSFVGNEEKKICLGSYNRSTEIAEKMRTTIEESEKKYNQTATYGDINTTIITTKAFNHNRLSSAFGKKTLLMQSVCTNNKKSIQYLIKQGVNLDIQDANGYTAILHAIRLINRNDNRAGMGIYKKDNEAMNKGLKDIIILLIKAGADTCLRTNQGERARDLVKPIYKTWHNMLIGSAIIAALDAKKCAMQ